MDHLKVQFVPQKLSKTDRPGHLGPPILIRAWPEDKSICPVAVIRELVSFRASLGILHPHLFFHCVHPHAPLTISDFRAAISKCLEDAGIVATPGSTRAMAASTAFARGASMWDVLRLGDWTRESTFLRFYASF